MATAEKSAQLASAAEHDEPAECPALGQVLDLIGDKWTVMVVGALSKCPMRFNSIMRLIGTKTLASWGQRNRPAIEAARMRASSSKKQSSLR